MNMQQQHLYRRHVQAQPGNVVVPSVQAPPQVEGAGAGLMRAVASAGGEILKVAGRAHVAEMQGRMEDSLLRVDSEFEKWKTEYMQTHQGADALDAQEVFANKYMELARDAEANFGGPRNEIFAGNLRQEFARRALVAVKEGGNYQIRQRSIWDKSRIDALGAELDNLIANNPNDPAMLELAGESYVKAIAGSTLGMGRDLGAIKSEVRNRIAYGMAQGMLNNDDLDGAEAFINGGGSAGGSGAGGTVNPDAAAGGTTSSRNLSVHNYGNVKNIDGKFNAYATRHDGLMAIAERIKSYNKKRGAKSISDVIHIYAPSDDHNDPKSYSAFLGKRLGVSPTAAIDFSDTKLVAGLVQGIAAMEHGAKKANVGDDEALAAAQAVAAGQMPRVVGRAPGKGQSAPVASAPSGGKSFSGFAADLTPTQRASLNSALQTRRKQAQELAIVGNVQSLIDASANLEPEFQKVAVLDEVAKIKDPQERKKAYSLAESQLKFLDDQRQAQIAATKYQLLVQGREGFESPTQFAQRVGASGLRFEDQQDVIKKFNGEDKENELNIRAAANMRLQIDQGRENGKPVSQNEIFKYSSDNRLTLGQTKELLQYQAEGGNIGKLKQSLVNEIWTDMQGAKGIQKKADDAPAWLYGAVLKILDKGKPPTREDVKKAISRALISGKAPLGWFGLNTSTTYGEALMAGKAEQFMEDDA